jgi:hypothetical protein
MKTKLNFIDFGNEQLNKNNSIVNTLNRYNQMMYPSSIEMNVLNSVKKSPYFIR